MYPDRGSNPQTFGALDDTPNYWATPPGQQHILKSSVLEAEPETGIWVWAIYRGNAYRRTCKGVRKQAGQGQEAVKMLL